MIDLEDDTAPTQLERKRAREALNTLLTHHDAFVTRYTTLLQRLQHATGLALDAIHAGIDSGAIVLSVEDDMTYQTALMEHAGAKLQFAVPNLKLVLGCKAEAVRVLGQMFWRLRRHVQVRPERRPAPALDPELPKKLFRKATPACGILNGAKTLLGAMLRFSDTHLGGEPAVFMAGFKWASLVMETNLAAEAPEVVVHTQAGHDYAADVLTAVWQPFAAAHAADTTGVVNLCANMCTFALIHVEAAGVPVWFLTPPDW